MISSKTSDHHHYDSVLQWQNLTMMMIIIMITTTIIITIITINNKIIIMPLTFFYVAIIVYPRGANGLTVEENTSEKQMAWKVAPEKNKIQDRQMGFLEKIVPKSKSKRHYKAKIKQPHHHRETPHRWRVSEIYASGGSERLSQAVRLGGHDYSFAIFLIIISSW